MARNTSVSLGDHFVEFIDRMVKEGRYASASDVVRAGLRLAEAEDAKLTRLRALIDEGDASGYSEGWDLDAFLTEMHTKNVA
jgi:antitoxin ParD1/3/4